MKIFICGDSTAASYNPSETRMVGWGQLLGDFLPGIPIVNLAMAGRSTRTFLAEGRLQPAEQAGAGDLILVQFAHNDENEKKPERYAAPRTAKERTPKNTVRLSRPSALTVRGTRFPSSRSQRRRSGRRRALTRTSNVPDFSDPAKTQRFPAEQFILYSRRDCFFRETPEVVRRRERPHKRDEKAVAVKPEPAAQQAFQTA